MKNNFFKMRIQITVAFYINYLSNVDVSITVHSFHRRYSTQIPKIRRNSVSHHHHTAPSYVDNKLLYCTIAPADFLKIISAPVQLYANLIPKLSQLFTASRGASMGQCV